MNESKNEPGKSKCIHCEFLQEDYKWKSDAVFEYDGKRVSHQIGGDHAKCPRCNKLVHIDYDLTKV